MTRDQQLLADLRNLVDKPPPEQAEAVNELAESLRIVVKMAGDTVGPLAIALIMAEINEK